MNAIERTDCKAAPDSQPAIDAMVSRQAGTLCIRSSGPSGQAEILLVASNRTGLWGIPKGHVEDGESSLETAMREAFEEGGVIGEVRAEPVGSYVYAKDDTDRLYEVSVYLMTGASQAPDYPESGRRRFQWVSLLEATQRLWHPSLRELVQQQASFRPF